MDPLTHKSIEPGAGLRRRLAFAGVLACLIACLVGAGAVAQDGPSSGGSAGPIGESGGSLRGASGPVSEISVGGMRSPSLSDSGTVRDAATRGMLSGPIREQGTAGRTGDGGPVSGNGPIGASSAGAVRGAEAPFPLAMERPVSREELEQLEQQLREIQPLAEE